MLVAPHGPVRVTEPLSTVVTDYTTGLLYPFGCTFARPERVNRLCVRIDEIKAVLGSKLGIAFMFPADIPAGRGPAGEQSAGIDTNKEGRES